VINGRALRADLVPEYLAALNNEAMMRGRNGSDPRRFAEALEAIALGKIRHERFDTTAGRWLMPADRDILFGP